MIGDLIEYEGEIFEVVWSGGELIPERDSKPSQFWTPPRSKRIYNKKSVFWTISRKGVKPVVDKVVEAVDDSEQTEPEDFGSFSEVDYNGEG